MQVSEIVGSTISSRPLEDDELDVTLHPVRSIIEDHPNEIVQAVLFGVSKTKIVKTLRVAWSTVHKWQCKLAPIIEEKGLRKPGYSSKTKQVQTLCVTETEKFPHQIMEDAVEIRVGKTFIRIIGGGSI